MADVDTFDLLNRGDLHMYFTCQCYLAYCYYLYDSEMGYIQVFRMALIGSVIATLYIYAHNQLAEPTLIRVIWALYHNCNHITLGLAGNQGDFVTKRERGRQRGACYRCRPSWQVIAVIYYIIIVGQIDRFHSLTLSVDFRNNEGLVVGSAQLLGLL